MVARNAKHAHRPRRAKSPIHHSIKRRLGYSDDVTDAEVLRDWRARLSRVCKPCWELKYCPYGPLVEQSPLLPPEQAGMAEHIEYLKRMLESEQLGEVSEITPERRVEIEEWLSDDDLIAWQAYHELHAELLVARAKKSDDPVGAFEGVFRGDLPPIEKYRVPYDIVPKKLDIAGMRPSFRRKLERRIQQRKSLLAKALDTGIEDTRRPLAALIHLRRDFGGSLGSA